MRKMKRKVWIVSWYGKQIGGLERIVQIISRILEPYYEVIVVDIPYLCRYKKIYKRLCLYSNNRLVLMALFSIFIKKAAKKEDIVITHGQNAPFIRSNFLFDHGSIMSLKRAIGENIYGGSSIFEFIAVRNTKMNVAVSDWTQREIINNYRVKKNKILVLNNCVETDMFYPVRRNKNGYITILFCGRLEKAKGLGLLLKIADLIENSHEFKLKIATNIDCNMQLFDNRPNILVECGIPVEKMNDFYNSGDVLIVPSKCEGFGMGIIESLSAGVWVMANKVGIVGELVEGNCPGIALIGEEERAGEILQRIREKSDEYWDFDTRLLMHGYIEQHYGFLQYRDKLLKLIREK